MKTYLVTVTKVVTPRTYVVLAESGHDAVRRALEESGSSDYYRIECRRPEKDLR